MVKKNRQFLVSVLLVLTLASCNLSRPILNKSHRQYEKAGLREWTTDSDSSSIHWRKVGRGDQKLLLIHGFGASAELQWEGVVAALHDEFTIYIPDILYFGQSTSQSHQFSPMFITRQLHASLCLFESDRVMVAGLSYGGLVAGLFAHQYPQKTRALVLIDALSPFASSAHTDSLAQAHGYNDIDEILIPENGKAFKPSLK
ncbi:MAG: alpha/beta hydrolase [Cyclobacteriaceae bacterium]|nr:alpha/beta hydrolase [Cyclobacteriaceae bacterium]